MSEAADNKRLDTVDTLAARFGLPRRTIMRELASTRLPYVSIAGQYRFRERDIEVWLERAGPMPKMTLHQGGLGSGDDAEPRAPQYGESAS